MLARLAVISLVLLALPSVCMGGAETWYILDSPVWWMTFDNSRAIEGDGSGHIQWAPDTPPGYRAPLSVGFQSYSDGTWGNIIFRYTYLYKGDMDVVEYDLRHTFYADYVPEPCSIAALLAGLAGLAWWRRR